MWELYDRLIEGISEEIIIDKIYQGCTWSVVFAGDHQGIASTTNEQNKPLKEHSELIGSSLREAAELAKSWDLLDASVGCAAINAYYNSKKYLNDKQASHGKLATGNTFDDYLEVTAGKKVAIIGHFIQLERFLNRAGEISVLERRPEEGDYPDSACEYILPEQDFVFITGSAMVNKTMPRLLKLCKKGGAEAIVLGPSTPMSEVMFDYGAHELSGLMLDIKRSDAEAVCGSREKMGRRGQRIRLLR